MIFISPNNEYPRFQGDIKIAHPSWNETMSLPDGWIPVLATEVPTVEPGQAVDELFPEELDGEHRQRFITRDLTKEELNSQELLRLQLESELKTPKYD
tara:strand:+ start:1974 stop:2267 length:294 start_codon:yes stop_codon:yes gene_type:complete